MGTRTFYNLHQEATFTQNNPHLEITDHQNNYKLYVAVPTTFNVNFYKFRTSSLVL